MGLKVHPTAIAKPCSSSGEYSHYHIMNCPVAQSPFVTLRSWFSCTSKTTSQPVWTPTSLHSLPAAPQSISTALHSGHKHFDTTSIRMVFVTVSSAFITIPPLKPQQLAKLALWPNRVYLSANWHCQTLGDSVTPWIPFNAKRQKFSLYAVSSRGNCSIFEVKEKWSGQRNWGRMRQLMVLS